MLFEEEESPFLKKWIVKRLENTSDADADVLADYVLALLRHDGDVETVRALCEHEMPDFLQGDSAVFVRDVFDAINFKSYMPGAANPPSRTSTLNAPPSGPSMPSYGSLGNGAPMGQNGSRKRSYHDRGDVEMQGNGFQNIGDSNGRSFKQPRRGGPGMGRGGGYDPRGGRGGFAGNRPANMNYQNTSQQGFPTMPPMPRPPPGMPFFDPREGLAGLEAMLGMGLPMSVLQGIPQGDSLPPRESPSTKPRCRDYDIKGFCARGNTCPYEHGQHSAWIPPSQKGDEYDPTTSLMSTLEASTGGRGGFNQFQNHDRGRGRGQRGNFTRSRGGGGARAEFSSNAPNYDKNNTTIVVENIPEDKFTEDEVRSFFSEFGNIVDVSMRPYKRLAVVKYDDWNSANSAYKSPKVIFDNRFVKVYWFKDVDSLPTPPTATGANGEPRRTSEATAAPAEQEPEIDLEEFSRKQAEAQKVHEDKLKKKLELENTRKELEKRQAELMKSQAEEKRKLMERIATKSKKTAPPPDSRNGTSETPDAKQLAHTEALKALLGGLEEEAKILGIDPDAPVTEPSPFGYRGRGRGRGEYRGGYRGRGAFTPRGSRGGFRGRGGVPFSASGRSFNLDNRPKKVGMTGVDFTDSGKEEGLREYLLGVGEYTDLEITPTRTAVLFKDRFTAEKFMGTPNSEIPSVGKVEMSWIQTPLPPVVPKSSHTTVKVDDDTAMDEGDAMAGYSAPVEADVVDEHQNYDYDVAGEDEWN